MLVLRTDIPKPAWLAFAPSGRLLAVGDSRGLECRSLNRPDAPHGLWRWNAREPRFAFLSDTRLLVSLGRMCVWVTPGVPLAWTDLVGVLHRSPAGGLAVNPDGSAVALPAKELIADQQVYTCWRLTGEKPERLWSAPADGDGTCRAVAFLADGRHLVAAEGDRVFGDDGPVRYGVLGVRDAATGELVKQHSAPANPPGGLAVHPTTRQTVVLCKATLGVWDDPVSESFTREVRSDNRKYFTDVAYHPDGRRLFATSNDETVRVYDTGSWEVMQTFTWGVGKLLSVAVSADGTQAAAGGTSGRVVVWDADG